MHLHGVVECTIFDPVSKLVRRAEKERHSSRDPLVSPRAPTPSGGATIQGMAPSKAIGSRWDGMQASERMLSATLTCVADACQRRTAQWPGHLCMSTLAMLLCKSETCAVHVRHRKIFSRKSTLKIIFQGSVPTYRSSLGHQSEPWI